WREVGRDGREGAGDAGCAAGGGHGFGVWLRGRDGAGEVMPDRLYFTDSDEANALIARDPFALLLGVALDQRVRVMKAFRGPLVLRERLGSLEPAAVAAADLEPLFRTPPGIHRFPAMMAVRVRELAQFIVDRYDGDAARVWTDASTSEELRANI